MIQGVAIILRTIVLGAFLGLAGWWTYFLRDQFVGHKRALETIESLEGDIKDREGRIEELDLEVGVLSEDLDRARQQIKELEVSMWLLKVNHRVARIEVLEQGPSADDPSRTTTLVRFEELGPDGETVGPPREIEIDGKVLYIEGLVIKFGDDYVEGGDLLRGTSVAIFKRVFSENQAPSEGVEIDRPRTHPLPHRGDDLPDPFYEDLWERFWDYANDPQLAASKGVRAMHGEAPSIELRPGKTYRVELRASGGLTIRVE
ncbi:MAG: hypothetical protein V3T22_08180 [Planctomycetota bacterium]